jgi:RNA polymerase sigma factor (sigma-70 family)
MLEMLLETNTRDKAFPIFVSKYQKKVYFLCRKMVIDHDDANDLTQETFIKAYRGLSNFRADAQIFTWLYRIATNECLSFLAKKKKRNLIPDYEVEHELASKIDAGILISGDDIQIKLQKAILTLPDKQRLVFNMKYFDDLKYEEMSEILGTSVGALKASYHHAVKKIEDFINNT